MLYGDWREVEDSTRLHISVSVQLHRSLEKKITKCLINTSR